MINLNNYDLARVNSLTKYPSIPTYHALVGGKLVEPSAAAPVTFPPGPVSVTEKVDGTNGRIVFTWDDYLIGSREEFIYAKGDRIGDKKDGLMDALKPIAEHLITWRAHYNGVTSVVDDYEKALESVIVAYFEVYGGRVNGHKQYTTSGKVGVRLFDVAVIQNADELLQQPPEKLASWRDHGGQPFLDVGALGAFATKLDLATVPPITGNAALTSAATSVGGPLTLQEALCWLSTVCPQSAATLDVDAPGRPEGVVIRSHDRKAIAKLRFEDYRRALRGQ